MGRPRPACDARRPRFATLSTLVLAALACAPVIAAPPKPLSTAIAPQNLASAIGRFQELTGINVSWPPNLNAAALHSEGAAAGLPPQKALTQLLRGTGLAFTPISERVVKIYVLPPQEP